MGTSLQYNQANYLYQDRWLHRHLRVISIWLYHCASFHLPVSCCKTICCVPSAHIENNVVGDTRTKIWPWYLLEFFWVLGCLTSKDIFTGKKCPFLPLLTLDHPCRKRNRERIKKMGQSQPNPCFSFFFPSPFLYPFLFSTWVRPKKDSALFPFLFFPSIFHFFPWA